MASPNILLVKKKDPRCEETRILNTQTEINTGIYRYTHTWQQVILSSVRGLCVFMNLTWVLCTIQTIVWVSSFKPWVCLKYEIPHPVIPRGSAATGGADLFVHLLSTILHK
uniref:Uncharacterized protein n=1 Tax=Cacopsylla melanoneura TaxID=428564 RepID=A0A8D8W746_9HEMI